MGTGRGLAGIAISSTMMGFVQKHFMGRVQNTFFFIGTSLQLAASVGVGMIAEHVSLALAFGMIGVLYGVAALTSSNLFAQTLSLKRTSQTIEEQR
jgi:hypothetical protein